MIDDYDHQFSDLCPLVWNIARSTWSIDVLKARMFREMAVVGTPCKTFRLKVK